MCKLIVENVNGFILGDCDRCTVQSYNCISPNILPGCLTFIGSHKGKIGILECLSDTVKNSEKETIGIQKIRNHADTPSIYNQFHYANSNSNFTQFHLVNSNSNSTSNLSIPIQFQFQIFQSQFRFFRLFLPNLFTMSRYSE